MFIDLVSKSGGIVLEDASQNAEPIFEAISSRDEGLPNSGDRFLEEGANVVTSDIDLIIVLVGELVVVIVEVSDEGRHLLLAEGALLADFVDPVHQFREVELDGYNGGFIHFDEIWVFDCTLHA